MILPTSENLFEQFIPLLGEVRSIVEVGSHQMQDAPWMMRRFPGVSIACFEPDPRSIAFVDRSMVLEKLVTAYPLSHFEFHPAAVGAEVKWVDFYLSTNFSNDPDDEWTQSSSLRRPKPHNFGTRETLGGNPCVFDETPVRVQVVPLDAFPRFWPVDLLWIDAQGSEDEIIKGASKTLTHTRFAFMEHNTSEYENAPTLKTILDLLPDWEAVKVLTSDVFLRNRNFHA